MKIRPAFIIRQILFETSFTVNLGRFWQLFSPIFSLPQNKVRRHWKQMYCEKYLQVIFVNFWVLVYDDDYVIDFGAIHAHTLNRKSSFNTWARARNSFTIGQYTFTLNTWTIGLAGRGWSASVNYIEFFTLRFRPWGGLEENYPPAVLYPPSSRDPCLKPRYINYLNNDSFKCW